MPFVAVLAGIASFSVMDGLMKGASLAVGAYNAMLWRSLVSALVMLPFWMLSGGIWPRGQTLRLHAVRGLNGAAMGPQISAACRRHGDIIHRAADRALSGRCAAG
jgi:S-adenosylmethionine uptake transporter